MMLWLPLVPTGIGRMVTPVSIRSVSRGARTPKLHPVELFDHPIDAIVAPEELARDVEGGHAEYAVALGFGRRGLQLAGTVALRIAAEACGVEPRLGHHGRQRVEVFEIELAFEE